MKVGGTYIEASIDGEEEISIQTHFETIDNEVMQGTFYISECQHLANVKCEFESSIGASLAGGWDDDADDDGQRHR